MSLIIEGTGNRVVVIKKNDDRYLSILCCNWVNGNTSNEAIVLKSRSYSTLETAKKGAFKLLSK